MLRILLCLGTVLFLTACETDQGDMEELNDIPEAVEGVAA
jgi:hypothetical protein